MHGWKTTGETQAARRDGAKGALGRARQALLALPVPVPVPRLLRIRGSPLAVASSPPPLQVLFQVSVALAPFVVIVFVRVVSCRRAFDRAEPSTANAVK